MPLADKVVWFIDATTHSGLTSERLVAAVPVAEGLWCGLVLSFPAAGAPTLEVWDRIDDLERQGFVPIGSARARAISDALPRFLERLEQATDARAQVTKDAARAPRASRLTPEKEDHP